MVPRRVPAGSLAALAVVLAALAVVVVAGSRAPLVQVLAPSTTTTAVTPTTLAPPASTTTTTTSPPSGATGELADQSSPPPPTAPPASTTSSTTPAPPSSTTTTTAPIPVGAPPILEDGTFAHGEDATTLHLRTVRDVEVRVAVGVAVTLELHCGVVSRHTTEPTLASIRLRSVAEACTATIEVPASTPATSWHLVATT